MAPWHNRCMVAFVIVLAFYLEGCSRQSGASEARAAGAAASADPPPATVSAAPDGELDLLRVLRAGAHRAEVSIRLTVNGQALPPAELDLTVTGQPAAQIVARGRSRTADGDQLVEFTAEARDGRIRYRTSALDEWVEEPFGGIRQIYNMVGGIDDVGLLLTAALEGIARPADGPSAGNTLRLAADGLRLGSLLETKEDVHAEVLQAEFAVTRQAARAAVVESRLVLAVGVDTVEMNVMSAITGLEQTGQAEA